MPEENVLFARETEPDAAAADGAPEILTDKYLIFVSDNLFYGIDAEQVETDVEEAEDAAGSAIDGIDEDTAGKIDKAEEAVKDSEKVVDAANDTVAEAVNTANSAQQTVETAQQCQRHLKMSIFAGMECRF